MQIIRYAALAAFSFTLTGCVALFQQPGYRDLEASDEYRRYEQARDRLRERIENCIPPSCSDSIIDLLQRLAATEIWIENARFRELARQFGAEATQAEIAFDAAIELMTAAGTLSYGGETNELLSLGAGLGQAADQSFRRHAYGDLQVTLIIGTMAHDRETIINEIVSGLNSNSYNYADLVADLDQLREAGTIERARRRSIELQAIQLQQLVTSN